MVETCEDAIANLSVTEGFSFSDTTRTTSKKESTSVLEVVRVPAMNRIKGISLFVMASLLASCNGALVKYMEGIPTGQMVMTVSMYATLYLTILLNYQGLSITKFPHKKWVLLRVVFVTVALCCKIWSIQNLPLGNANALVFTSPIMTCVLARIFLKEKLNLIHVFAITAGLGGLILIAKPTFILTSDVNAEVPLWYNAVPLVAALCLSISYVAQRYIGAHVSCFVVAFYGTFCQMLAGLLLQSVSGSTYVNPPCYTYRVMMPFCGLCMCIGFTACNKGLSYEKAATASLIRNLDTVLAFFLQVVAFGIPAQTLSLFGAAFIILGMISLALSKMFSIDCGITF